MTIEKNIDLKKFNSFGVKAKAKNFTYINDDKNIGEILSKFKPQDIFILGGGTNILFTRDIDKLVMLINTKGIDIEHSKNNYTWINIKAGESWDDLVGWAIKNNLGGIENLSLIPGKVGAAPIQNIGAYGCEIKDVLEQVEAIEISSQKKITLTNKDCQFSYRNSIFKITKTKYIITNITLKLTNKNHKLNYSYKDIKDEISRNRITKPNIKDISNIVKKIRRAKLPDPKIIGNAGSFFKNPIIDRDKFENIKTLYPSIPCFPIDDKNIKIPAAWLIEKCMWKGKKLKNASVHADQPLVLVNDGNAYGKDILELSQKIKSSIIEKFDIKLSEEVNIL